MFCLEHCIIAMRTRKSAIPENNNNGGRKKTSVRRPGQSTLLAQPFQLAVHKRLGVDQLGAAVNDPPLDAGSALADAPAPFLQVPVLLHVATTDGEDDGLGKALSAPAESGSPRDRSPVGPELSGPGRVSGGASGRRRAGIKE